MMQKRAIRQKYWRIDSVKSRNDMRDDVCFHMFKKCGSILNWIISKWELWTQIGMSGVKNVDVYTHEFGFSMYLEIYLPYFKQENTG